MAYCKAKTRYIAERSAEQFLQRHKHVYFITFTRPGHELDRPGFTRDKGECEKQFRPFKDRVRREGGEMLEFWERQKRGAWHVHCLVNKRYNAVELREWMMARGWGSQMFIKYVRKEMGYRSDDTHGSVSCKALVKYLVKYLTKSFTDDAVEPRKKFFGGSKGAKVGNVNFKWIPSIQPGAMLYFYGRQLWYEAFGKAPRFDDMRDVIACGVEAVDWLSVDPWYLPFG